MRLKIVTTLTMVIGLILMACWPFIMGGRPASDAPRAQIRDYAIRSATYFSVLLVLFFISFACAWLLLRQVRRELKAKSLENLQHLVEGALQDHAKK